MPPTDDILRARRGDLVRRRARPRAAQTIRQVAANGLKLRCVTDRELRTGEEHTIIIQPENIGCEAAAQNSLSPAAIDGANVFGGVIEDVSFRGRTQEIAVSAMGRTLRVVALGRKPFRPRDEVLLVIPWDAIRFV